MGTSVLGVYRENIFSPGKIREDAAILDVTLSELSRGGYDVSATETGMLDRFSKRPGCVLSMAQSDPVLRILEDWQENGTRIINSVTSVRNCHRKHLISLLGRTDFRIPPSQILPLEELESRISFNAWHTYWLKRGDVHATRPEDVVRVTSKKELAGAIDSFHVHQIREVLVQEHVYGETIKFYGVGADHYFKAFRSSSGEEITSEIKHLERSAFKSAEAVGLEIYGGDAILTEDGAVVLIDLNDWPSFSPCCEPAGKRIAKYVTEICEGGLDELSNNC